MANIKCGNCKRYHDSALEVRECYRVPPLIAVTFPGTTDVTEDYPVTDLPPLDDYFGPGDAGGPGDLWGQERVDHYLPANDTHVPVATPVPDGTYTVAFPDGSWRTIKFHCPDKGNWKGKQIVSFLRGPDNELDFTGLGHIQNGKLKQWRRADPDGPVLTAVDFIMRGASEDLAAAGELYALKSSRCCKCGRKLTVPASVHRGMGPDCASRF